jgi:hypothetical protein
LKAEQAEAREMIAESQASRRRVEAKDPHVRHMVGRLEFLSERNGFADAFERMLNEGRGGNHAGGG